jgi:hypothetical protein
MQRNAVLMLVAVALIIGSSGAVAEDPEQPIVGMHAERGDTPEGALHLWFEAVFLYMDEATRDQGREALTDLTIPFKDEPGWETLPSNRIFVERLQDPAHAHIFRSYAVGTSPANGYAMDPGDFELAVEDSSEDAHGRGHRVLLRSSGADSPRPVYMKRSTTTGLWYVSEFGNVYVGIRPPVDPAEERFE